MQRTWKQASLWLLGVAMLSACHAGSSSAIPQPTATPIHYVENLYVSEYGLNRVQSLDLTTGKVLATIPVGTKPTMMVYDHHTQNGWDNQADPTAALWVLNQGSASVTRIDPKTNKAVITIAVGGSPVDIAAAQNTSGLLYVADGQSNSIAIVNENDDSVIGHITTAGRPFELSANNSALMVAETNDTVELFDDTKPSTAPITAITTQAALMGVGTYYDTDPAIETADGLIHFYKPQALGGLPWTNVANYKLPHGAGQLEGITYGNYAVINAGSNLVQWVTFDSNGDITKEYDLATGTQPGFASTGDSGQYGYFYIPDAGSDSLSVYWQSWQPYASWPLAAGAHPIDTVTLQYQVTSTPAPTASPAPTPTPTATPTGAPAAAGHLYVANGSGGNLLEYTAPFSASSTPSVNLNVGGSVYGVAANSSYVAVEDSTGYVYLFAQPLTAGASPVAQFQAGGTGGQLLFDSSGNLFSSTQNVVVLEFTPPFSNSTTPSATISGSPASFSLAMDSNGNLYVGDLGMNEIDAYAPPYTASPVKVMQPGTYGLAYYQNAVYGADAMGNAVDVYSLPLGTSSTPVFGIPVTDPHAVTFDNAGNLYAADQTDKKIEVFAQPFSSSSTPSFSITSGVTEPVQMTFGP